MDRSFGALWAATTRFVAGNLVLLLPVAAAFSFLPQLLLSYGMRDMPADAAAIPDGLRLRFVLLLAIVMSSSVIGQLTVVQLVLGRSGTLGEIIGRSLRLFLPGLAATLMQSLAIAFGMLLLILPGLYLMGRLILTLSVVADRGLDPVAALRHSWALTEGQGFRILMMVLALFLAMLTLLILMGGIGAAIGVVGAVAGVPAAESGWSIGAWLFELSAAALSAVLGLYFAVFVAQLYRALKG